MDRYQKIYVDLKFERAGLFAAVQKHFPCATALYPGCSVHITPSFYIPHVVYIDRSPEAEAFFADLQPVTAYVERRKTYRRRPYLRFIAADYTQPLPLPDASFDLLIALFAGPVFEACRRYLRLGGLLLTNRSQLNSAAVLSAGYQPRACIRWQKGAYRLDTIDLEKRLGEAEKVSHPSYLSQVDDGLVYRETDTYFLFANV